MLATLLAFEEHYENSRYFSGHNTMFFEIHFCTKDSLEDIVFCFPSKIADLSILITNLVQGVTLHLVLVVRLLSGYQTKIGVNW